MENKICTKCKESKALSEFSFKNKAKGTKAFECKVCHRVMRKTYYENNKKSEIARVRARKYLVISWYKDYKKKQECGVCGENHPATLDFHHRDPSEKRGLVSYLAKFGSIGLLKAEINKCDVLCSNCHRKHHHKD